MTLIEALVLGLIQGLTEFLPVSSSGHLVLGQAIFGISSEMKAEIGVAFEVFVHFATLLAVVSVYWQDIVKLVRAFFSIFKFNTGTPEQKYHTDPDFRLMVLILAASVPAGLIGIALEDIIEATFTSPLLVACMLLVTGGILFSTRFLTEKEQPLNSARAILIGFAQAVAILPGISRSGSTISTGIFCGLKREEAAKFSFLMSIPVIAGATLLKLKDMLVNPPPTTLIFNIGMGMIVAYLSGILAIKLLLKVIGKGKFEFFAYYCFLIGIISLVWLTR
ncbi:undecaprenyl-diphosphate phosphatase [candidate division KSB1 bacterium]|nr:undecaprenyl-diphosphate phosphatase [candidate division KSB1 bacterium]